MSKIEFIKTKVNEHNAEVDKCICDGTIHILEIREALELSADYIAAMISLTNTYRAKIDSNYHVLIIGVR